MNSHRRLSVAAIVAVMTVTAVGCVDTSNQATRQSVNALATPTVGPTPAATPTTAAPQCDPRASLRPTAVPPPVGQMPAGTLMSDIQARGRLIVGVDQNTRLFAFRDTRTGTLQGYEIDLLRKLALAIFGSEDAIEFKTLTTAQRLNAVKDGTVDIVASLATMTCARWEEVLFSTEYYEAAQKVLVRRDAAGQPTIPGIAELAGKKVCATQGSTSIDNLRAKVPTVIIYPVVARTDCLVALQDGTVDAITADDTILLGFVQQDKRTTILSDQVHDEPYGMIVNQRHPEFVRFVNGVLQQLRENGTLDEIDQRWLLDIPGRPTPTPPAPRYQD